MLSRPLRRPIDGGRLSGLACCSLGRLARPPEEAAHVHCGIGSWGARCLSMAPYVGGMGATRGGQPPEGANVAYARVPQSLLQRRIAWTVGAADVRRAGLLLSEPRLQRARQRL